MMTGSSADSAKERPGLLYTAGALLMVIIIGLLIWFNLVSQVYLVSAAWSAVREVDLKSVPAAKTAGWGARQVQPGKTPAEPRARRRPAASFLRRGTDRPTPK